MADIQGVETPLHNLGEALSAASQLVKAYEKAANKAGIGLDWDYIDQAKEAAYQAFTDAGGDRMSPAVEARHCAVLSTGHLSENSAEILERLAGLDPRGAYGNFYVESSEFALSVYPMLVEPGSTFCSDLPDLTQVHDKLCGELGFDALVFDRDALTVEGLPVYDW